MKKTGLFAIALIGAASMFASCKKDFNCTCTDAGISYTYTMKESTKAAAAAVCEGKGIGSIEVAGISQSTTNNCTLE